MSLFPLLTDSINLPFKQKQKDKHMTQPNSRPQVVMSQRIGRNRDIGPRNNEKDGPKKSLARLRGGGLEDDLSMRDTHSYYYGGRQELHNAPVPTSNGRIPLRLPSLDNLVPEHPLKKFSQRKYLVPLFCALGFLIGISVYWSNSFNERRENSLNDVKGNGFQNSLYDDDALTASPTPFDPFNEISNAVPVPTQLVQAHNVPKINAETEELITIATTTYERAIDGTYDSDKYHGMDVKYKFPVGTPTTAPWYEEVKGNGKPISVLWKYPADTPTTQPWADHQDKLIRDFKSSPTNIIWKFPVGTPTTAPWGTVIKETPPNNIKEKFPAGTPTTQPWSNFVTEHYPTEGSPTNIIWKFPAGTPTTAPWGEMISETSPVNLRLKFPAGTPTTQPWNDFVAQSSPSNILFRFPAGTPTTAPWNSLISQTSPTNLRFKFPAGTPTSAPWNMMLQRSSPIQLKLSKGDNLRNVEIGVAFAGNSKGSQDENGYDDLFNEVESFTTKEKHTYAPTKSPLSSSYNYPEVFVEEPGAADMENFANTEVDTFESTEGSQINIKSKQDSDEEEEILNIDEELPEVSYHLESTGDESEDTQEITINKNEKPPLELESSGMEVLTTSKEDSSYEEFEGEGEETTEELIIEVERGDEKDRLVELPNGPEPVDEEEPTDETSEEEKSSEPEQIIQVVQQKVVEQQVIYVYDTAQQQQYYQPPPQNASSIPPQQQNPPVAPLPQNQNAYSQQMPQQFQQIPPQFQQQIPQQFQQQPQNPQVIAQVQTPNFVAQQQVPPNQQPQNTVYVPGPSQPVNNVQPMQTTTNTANNFPGIACDRVYDSNPNIVRAPNGAHFTASGERIHYHMIDGLWIPQVSTKQDSGVQADAAYDGPICEVSSNTAPVVNNVGATNTIQTSQNEVAFVQAPPITDAAFVEGPGEVDRPTPVIAAAVTMPEANSATVHASSGAAEETSNSVTKVTTTTTAKVTSVETENDTFIGRKPCIDIEITDVDEENFHAPSSEDEALYEIFYSNPVKSCGTVVEIGSGDGKHHSKSYFFENSLHWNAILIEANPELFANLEVNRPKALRVNGAFCEGTNLIYKGNEYFDVGAESEGKQQEVISELYFDPNAEDMSENSVPEEFNATRVPCVNLGPIFHAQKLKKIDVLYIGVNGDPLAVIREMDWTIRVDIWVIELPGINEDRDELVRSVLLKNDYVKAEWDIKRWCNPENMGNCKPNEVYLQKGYNPLPQEVNRRLLASQRRRLSASGDSKLMLRH